LAARSAGDSSAASTVRWVSTLLGLALVWVTFFLIADLFPENPWLAVCSAGFVALLPMNVSLCASITNDTLTNLIAALGLWQIVRIAKGICRRPHSALILGLMLGLGIWTKTSTLVLFPTALVAYWLLARTGVMPLAVAAKRAAVACGFGLLIGLPWLIRNTVLYGDPLARHIFLTAFQSTMKATTMMGVFHSLGLSSANYVVAVTQWTFASFWGVFDSMTWFWGRDPQDYGSLSFFFHPPPVIYSLLAIICVLSLVGLLRYVRTRNADPAGSHWPSPTLEPSQQAVLGAFLTLIVMTILAFIAFNVTFFQAQGRYLYTALVPFAFFLALGLGSLVPRRIFRRGAAIFMLLLLIGLNFFSIALLGARFGTG
ncbi:MAG TPA: glycosyltransferase family 39 protein, partial [Capsulimonadaceae bacterium]|nr:glycosyltransferase family 39 protein [Capsulimonadaceae bacterium]